VAVLAWLLFALLALVLLTLLAPWHLRFDGRTSPLSARVELRLLAGLAPPIPIPLGRNKDAPHRAKRAKPKRSGRRRSGRLPRGIGALILDLFDAVRIRSLHLSGRFGLDDPADTGVLWGRMAPLVYTLSGAGRRIDLVPEFSGPCLDLEATGEVAIRPVRLLRAGAVLAWANRGRPA
jgi:hypothetical protein